MYDIIKLPFVAIFAFLLLESCLPTPVKITRETDEPATVLNTAEAPNPSGLSIVSPTSNLPEKSVMLQVAENTPMVTQLVAKDSGSDNIEYFLQAGPDKDLFHLNPNTGALSFKAPPDWENPQDDDGDNNYHLYWGVTSDTGQVKGQFIIIQVINLPE